MLFSELLKRQKIIKRTINREKKIVFLPKLQKMNSRADRLKAFDRLLTIMDELRGGCTWDKKQTMESLRHLTIEETYELGDAIIDNELQEMKKELGDVLWYIAQMATELGADMNEIAEGNSEKLYSRKERGTLHGSGDNR